MAATLDPYSQWLGIPAQGQPPDHYRLLGLVRYESDPDVIVAAADKRYGDVRAYQAGIHSELAVKLLAEIASARVCLTDPKRKAAYDAQLPGLKTNASPVGTLPSATTDSTNAAAVAHSLEPPPFKNRSGPTHPPRTRPRASLVPYVLAGLSATGVLAVVAVVWQASPRPHSIEIAVGQSAPKPRPFAEPALPNAGTSNALSEPTPNPPAADPQPQPTSAAPEQAEQSPSVLSPPPIAVPTSGNELPYDRELLTNPSCELPLENGQVPGWTAAVGGWHRRGSNPLAFAGKTYFCPDDGAVAMLTQEVSVDSFASSIDASQQQFEIVARMRSYKQDHADTTRLRVTFLDDLRENILHEFDSGAISSKKDWREVRETVVAPAGTRWIRFTLISRRGSGKNNDGYFDDLSLRASPPQTPPR